MHHRVTVADFVCLPLLKLYRQWHFEKFYRSRYRRFFALHSKYSLLSDESFQVTVNDG
jgi:hypothetical protein